MTHQRQNTLMRRKQIAIAVKRLLVKHGSEHLTVRRVAKEIGLSESAIYRYFKSKRDVISFLVDDIERTLLSDFNHNNKPGITEFKNIELVMMRHISVIEKKKGVSFLVIAEIVSLGDKKLNKQIYNVLQKYKNSIKEVLYEGLKAGIIREDVDLDALSEIFFGMTQGLVNTWALNNRGFNLKEKYSSMWDVFRQTVLTNSNSPVLA